MRELTSIAIFLIVCLYVFIGSLYVYNKDYTGEKAEISTVKSDNDDAVVVYIPKYMVHLDIPKKELTGKDEFILQKDYELDSLSKTIIGLFTILSISLLGMVVICLTDEIEIYK